jgi:iron complex outermembrane receptor protein
LGPGGTSVSIDTGDATIKGIETELMFVPVKWFDLTARYAYLDATFDQLTQTTAILANGSPVRRDLSGNRLSRTPKHALNAEAGFTTPYASWGWLRAAVGVDHQSEIFDDNDNDFIEYRRPRINDDFSAQVWVHNLTDKEYRVHQADTAGGLFVLYGAPRQYGLTFNTRF